MKKSLLCIALFCTASAVSADVQSAENNYPKNPVLRPLTLSDGTIALSGSVQRGEEEDDKRSELNLNAAYGLTDNFTLGLGGIKYRFLARKNNSTGLELAVSAGFRGYQDSKVNGDAVATGVDLNGKYVFNHNFAMTFGVGYAKWNEEKLEDKDEFRYSVGAQMNVAKDWTAFASYTYRDLKDFEQEDAHEGSLGLNYSYNKHTDIGVFANYSGFDARENGYDLENSLERSAGVYVTYRF